MDLRRGTRSSLLVVVFVVVALVGAAFAGPAAAGPLDVSSDRTDNGFSFTYDSTTGEITQAASSLRYDSRDPVSFIINIRENPKSDDVGERLRARLSLGLNRGMKRAVRYDGTFWFEITDRTDTVAFTDSEDRRIVLRPRPGWRRSVIRFNFDLPSGTYDAKALFSAN